MLKLHFLLYFAGERREASTITVYRMSPHQGRAITSEKLFVRSRI
jgi:hypothetical protein